MLFCQDSHGQTTKIQFKILNSTVTDTLPPYVVVKTKVNTIPSLSESSLAVRKCLIYHSFH